MFIPILQMRNLRSAWLQSLGEKSLFWVFHSGERKNYKILLSFPIPLWRADSMERPWCWERSRAEEKGTTEDEMVGWHHWLKGPEFEQTPGVGEGQGSLVSMGLQSRTWLRDWTELKKEICDDFSLLKIKPQLVINVTKPATKYMKRIWNTTLGTVVS